MNLVLFCCKILVEMKLGMYYIINILKPVYYWKNSKIFAVLIILLFGIYLLIYSQLQDPYYSPLPVVNVEPNCSQLFVENNDPTVFIAAENWKVPLNELHSDFELSQKIDLDCDSFINQSKYFINSQVNEEETNFPIAFSLLVYKDASQVERLLRMIYRPWNYYCIHIDLKSDKNFVKAIGSLVKCLNKNRNNMINTSNRLDVQWGEMTVLTADLNCMEELYKKFKNWKYFINLTGQEFPLKTNAELVKILLAFKGANNVDGTYQYRDNNRVPVVHMPFPLVWFKGSVHITVNREFVKFIFESSKSTIMLNALKFSQVPDEQFFATLNYNAQLRIPGAFIGNPDDYLIGVENLSFFLTRYKNRGIYTCQSKQTIRGLCIWGGGDLPTLITVPHLFANKFFENFQPITLRCLEKWYYIKVYEETASGKVAINQSFYNSLPFVKYRYISIRDDL